MKKIAAMFLAAVTAVSVQTAAFAAEKRTTSR